MKQRLAHAIAALADAPVSLDAYERRFAVPPSDEEVEETMQLVRWFRRRYPTAKERFAYVRRKHAEWTRNPPAPIERLL